MRTLRDSLAGTLRIDALLVVAVLYCFAAHAQDPVSFRNEGVVEAPIAEVWKVFSTSEGYRTLGPALAEVDLRLGGAIRSRYRADGTLGDAETIENVILAYDPPTMIAIKIQKPPASFPFKQAWRDPWTVITLAPLDGERTLLRVSSLGFGADEEALAMRRFFEAGNQETIGHVQKHFAAARAAAVR